MGAVQAARRVKRECPGIDIQVFSDLDITDKRAEMEAALQGADVFFGSLLFDYDQVRNLGCLGGAERHARHHMLPPCALAAWHGSTSVATLHLPVTGCKLSYTRVVSGVPAWHAARFSFSIHLACSGAQYSLDNI